MENAKERFVQAFMEAERLDYAKLPSEDEIKWDFSEKFKKSMNKLIRKNNRIQLSTRRAVTKSLIAAIVAIMVLFAGLMSVAATREPIIEFIKKIFPKYNEITLSENSVVPVAVIETEYTLTDVPDGFVLDSYQKDDCGTFAIWRNSTGEEITFSQDVLNLNVSVDTEHGYKELDINGYPAYLIHYEQNTILFWTDGKYCFTLNVPIRYKDEIITISASICEKN